MWLWGQSSAGHMAVLVPLHGLINWLLLYGLFFVSVPLCRWLVLKFMNGKIESRNALKEGNAAYVKNASGDLLKKLQQAASFRSHKPRSKPTDAIVYRSDKDLLDQEFDH
jgi:hypothetical protein